MSSTRTRTPTDEDRIDGKMDSKATDTHSNTHDLDVVDEKQHGVRTDEEGSLAQITLPAMLLAIGICVGGFLFGYDIGVISGCLIMQPFVEHFGGVPDPQTGALGIPADVSSLIVATLSIGTFVGAMAQAPVSDFFGRKYSMLVWAGFFTLGAVIQTASGTGSTDHNLSMMYAGRFFAGCGVGALSGLSPLYLAETAPKAIRGAMVACYQLFIIFGIFLSYAISYGSAQLTTSASWRIPVGLQLAWGVLLIAIMIGLPESPRWLLQRERPIDARRVMAKMRGVDLVDDGVGGLKGDKYLELDLKEMTEGINEEAAAFANYNYITAYALCFSSKNQMWRRTLTGMMLQLLQQLCGQNFYYYYGPTFFKASGAVLDPLLIQLIFGVVSLICTVPALLLIEKMGRRNALMIGAIAQGICSFVVAFVGRFGIPPAGQTATTTSQMMSANAFIAFAVLHLAAFSMFWGPTPWIFCSENFPQHLRAKCISLCSATNWVWNFLLSFFSAKIAAQYDSYIMLIFGSVLFFSFIFTFLVVPELKGLSLEQVDEMYENKKLLPWQTPKWVPSHGRDTNRNAIGLSAIIKLSKKK